MTTNNKISLYLNHNPHRDKAAAKAKSAAILHQLLEDACPESVPFTILRNENGKPYCEAPLFFSYSHSRTAYLYGFDTRGPIGVDIETTAKKRDVLTLARRFFHEDEAAQLEPLTAQQQTHLFYRLWSRKEACCKLFGGVLWYYLAQSVLDNQFVDKASEQTVYLTDIDCIAGFAAAVATTEPIKAIWINTLS